MKKQLLALSIITALTACDSDDDKTIAQAPASFSGDLTTVLSKAENPVLNIKVDDPNVNESLIHSGAIEGKYGKFSINAAGDWDYVLYVGENEHPDITALVSSENADLTENPFVIRSADGTTQTVQITLEGIDVPATFAGSIFPSINRDTGSISTSTSVRDANPAEAAFLPAIEQMGAEEVDGVVQIKTMYGVVTITVIEPVIGVAGVEAVAAADAIPEVLAVPEVPATETEPAIPAVPYQPAVPAVEAVEGVTAVKAVLGSVDWTYELDATNEAVKALEVDEIPEDKTTLPTLEDTFTLTTLDGTEQTIEITIKASEKVPADIDAIPGGIDVELTEQQIEAGEVPVVNPDAEVNINVPNVSGTLLITDPNLAQESFEVQEDITTSYGTFAIDANGAWTYALNTDLDVIKDHKGDGVTKPDALMDNIMVNAVDGTEATLPITINALVGGNLTAEVNGGAEDAIFRIKMPADAKEAGKMTFKVNYAASGTKDAKIIFFGRSFNSDDKRTMAAISLTKNGEIKLMDGSGTKATFAIDQTHTPGEWFDVAFTWDATADAKVGGFPAISLSIDGTPVTTSGGQFSGDSFPSLSIASFIVGIGVDIMQFSTQGGSGGALNIDDMKIYSDVAGTTEVYSQGFDDLSEGSTLSLDISESATKGTIIGPLVKPE